MYADLLRLDKLILLQIYVFNSPCKWSYVIDWHGVCFLDDHFYLKFSVYSLHVHLLVIVPFI